MIAIKKFPQPNQTLTNFFNIPRPARPLFVEIRRFTYQNTDRQRTRTITARPTAARNNHGGAARQHMMHGITMLVVCPVLGRPLLPIFFRGAFHDPTNQT